jgi:hypothetical protein
MAIGSSRLSSGLFWQDVAFLKNISLVASRKFIDEMLHLGF